MYESYLNYALLSLKNDMCETISILLHKEVSRKYLSALRS